MLKNKSKKGDGHSHGLGEFRSLVVDVGHPHADRRRSRVRLVASVHRHHHKLVQMVGPLEVQPPRGENGPVGGDAEIRAQGVISELGV